jgi:hypothetical protein
MPCGSYDPVDSMLHEVALANMHVVCILLQFLIGESQYRNLEFGENPCHLLWIFIFLFKTHFWIAIGTWYRIIV